jgi:hypothetical protein
MMKSFAAFAFAALTLAQPASAITFPSLTTIYVGPGVFNLEADPFFSATAFSCSNVSGQTASMRFLILGKSGSPVRIYTLSLVNGANVTIATESIDFLSSELSLQTGNHNNEGTVSIESTQSGVFCTAMMVDPTADVPSGIALHLVRINPHPGTVE